MCRIQSFEICLELDLTGFINSSGWGWGQIYAEINAAMISLLCTVYLVFLTLYYTFHLA